MDYFADVLGHAMIKTYLTRMMSKEAVGHALIFAGPDGIGKSLIAQGLAAAVMRLPQKVAHHPDLHLYRPEGKLGMHSIHSMRQLTEEVCLPPYQAPWKVFILHEADRMLSTSANALLKTFEEPPPATLLILITNNPSNLLPTIRSRCRTVYFQALEDVDVSLFLQQKYQLSSQEADQYALLAQGSIARAIALVDKKGSPVRDLLFQTLMSDEPKTYKELTQLVQHLVQQLEIDKDKIEEGYIPKEQLSSYQQQQFEKELESTIALKIAQNMHTFIEYLLSWYRDLHLLKLKGSPYYLINVDYKQALENVLQRGNLLSLEKIQQIGYEAQLALQRSTSLQLCLENLLLKIL